MTAHQNITTLSGGFYMVPQYATSVIDVFEASTGSLRASFGSGHLNHPFRAVESASGNIFVTSPDGQRISEFSRSGLAFGWVRDYTMPGASYPNGLDYCPMNDSVYAWDLATAALFRCVVGSGACTVVATLDPSALGYGVVLRVDPNTSDCTLFLGYGYGNSKIARIGADGTLIDSNWVGTLGATIFELEFEIPAP